MCSSAARTSGITSEPLTSIGRVDRLRSATCITARFSVKQRLRRGDELEDLFETFLQMAHSLEALQAGRRATLDSTIAKAEKAQVPPEVMSGLRALHAQLSLGLATSLRKGAR